MSKSSQLTSVFWFAYGASRIVGIVGSKYLIPRTYILLAMTGSSTQKLRIRLSFYFSWWNWKWFSQIQPFFGITQSWQEEEF